MLSGWIVSIIQFIVNRRNQQKDKLLDRKYEAYSSYMKKYDEVMQNVRKDPSKLMESYNKIFVNMLNNASNEEAINNELINFNQELSQYVLNAVKPLIILKNELNNLILICSDELKNKIDEMVKLTQDYSNAVQKTVLLEQ
jgi:hypothetical protein